MLLHVLMMLECELVEVDKDLSLTPGQAVLGFFSNI